MFQFGGMIASAIKWMGGQAGIFGGMAEKSPRGTAWWSLLAGGAGVVGLKPEWLEKVAGILMQLSQAMQ